MKTETTIIITTWNSLEFLKLCLEKLFLYTKVPFNTIIVDNGSTDKTQKYVEQFIRNNNKQIKHIRNEVNKGTIGALVETEKYVDTKYVVLLDSDSIVSPNWLETFLEISKSNPKIKIIGPLKQGSQFTYPYRSDINSRQIWGEVKFLNLDKLPKEQLTIYCNGRGYEKFVEDFLESNKNAEKLLICPPELLSGCCLFLDFEFIKKYGGITNTSFEKYGGHDADRCWRVAKAGGLVLRTNKVYIHHFEGSSLKKNKLDYRPLLFENNRRLLDMWKKEIWEFIKNSNETLSELAEKYWLMRELLLSANKNQIPRKFISQYEDIIKKFVSTV